MTVVVVYLAVAVIVGPRCVRARYRRLRSSHPHTHPRDVRYDLTHAAVGGGWRALAWGPRGAWWLLQRGIVWAALRIVGRGEVAKDLRAARISMFEAELAALENDEELLGTVRALRRRVEDQQERVARMLSA